MEIPHYIPLDQAAKQYPISRDALTQAVETGKIRSVRVNGLIAVAEEDMRILAVELDKDLVGKPIRVTDAAEKYGVSYRNLGRWADAGYIRIIERRYSHLTLDEADVKRVATIFKKARKETKTATQAGWVLKRTMDYFK